MQKLFGAEDVQAAMKSFMEQVESYHLTSLEVAARWIAHHSALKDEDGIILGASSVQQVQETTAMVAKGPLPSDVVKLAEHLWDMVTASREDVI